MNELYNLCSGGMEPDWQQFDAIEISGCVNEAEADDESTCYCSGYNRHEAEIFTVFGHLREGGCDMITDCDTLDDAERIAAIFAAKTGYPVHVFC